jgi:type 1 fimbriae regulatory protein FimB/type 1 fimbriae regulatory protein FimE
VNAQVLTFPAQPAAKTAIGTVPPRRQENRAIRKREHLTEAEVEKLLAAAGKAFYGLRDRTMILLAYRHGLRVSELCALEWTQVIDLNRANRASLKVERLKGSISGTHPLEPDEVTALRKLHLAYPDEVYIFMNERGDRVTPAGFRKMLSRTAQRAGLGSLRVHPHMLRHSAGQALVDKLPLGMLADYLGHAQLQNTRVYTRTNGERFRGIWRRHK